MFRTIIVITLYTNWHQIDPKRAIPRDEQERTAKIFVGGVSQEADQDTFKQFFKQFGNVLDATLMMDKETNRPRGFGFVTFDSEAAVDRTLEQPLSICNKPIEIKRAQPRGDMREQERGGKFGRQGKQDQFNNNFGNQQQNAMGGGGNEGQNQMSPAMLAAYWQRMQQFFLMKQQQMAGMQGMNPMAAMQANPQMMQQFMAQQGGMNGGMNSQMMQQMAAMQGYPGMANNGGGSPMGRGAAGFNAQEQQMFEQQKYERQQQMARMGGGGSNTWDGMYDDVPAPAGMQGGRGGFGGGRGGRGGGNRAPQNPPQAPANAPTGPKNAGRPGANYRGGGRGGHRGYHPYVSSNFGPSRGGGGGQ
jgi:RNA-binding protein Musashi